MKTQAKASSVIIFNVFYIQGPWGPGSLECVALPDVMINKHI